MIEQLLKNFLPYRSVFTLGLFGFFFLLLSLRVIHLRWKEKISLGHKEDPHSKLFRIIRAHANFQEYIPFLLLQLLVLDFLKTPSLLIWSATGILFTARLLHWWGLERSYYPCWQRSLGAGGTFLVLSLQSAYLIYLSARFVF